MAATYNNKKGSAAVQSSVAMGASGDQRRARRSPNFGGPSSSSFYGSQSTRLGKIGYYALIALC